MWRSFKKAVRNRSTSRKSDGSQNEATPAAAPERSEGSGLYSLSNKKLGGDDTDAEPFEVDIVAIHGLNGDAYDTWTHHRSQKLWLRDMLPQDIPGARIYTYGYPSQLFFSRSTATISDYAMKLLAYLNSIRAGKERRPIIFIAHSLGGIVLKQALLLAQIDPSYQSILESTTGILFFATPHRGARGTPDMGILLGDVLDVGLRASGARLLTGKTTRRDLLSNLSANSEILRNISTSFRHLLGRFAIVTFYETEETRPMGRLIVDQDSAMMGVQGEKLIGIFANHTDICRFDSKDNTDYVVIVSEIQQLCRKVCHDPSLRESEKAAVRIFNDVDVNEYRSSLPKRIDGTCQWILHTPEYHSWATESEATLLWITGHPGSGKTVLSSFLTQQLVSISSSRRHDPIICFFFCNDSIENQRDAKAILRSIIFQILMERRTMVRHVKPLLDFDKDGVHLLNSYDRLWSIFSAIASDIDVGPINIIVDALDECEKTSRNRLMESIAKLLDRLRSMKSRCIRFLITSRPYLDITECFVKYEPRCLALEDKQKETDADLRMVIGQRVQEIAKRTKAKQDTVALLEKSLNENADRTFLWAKFALDLLDEDLRTAPGDFQRILAELPQDLQATYERFLRRIQPGKEGFAIKLLRLMIGSYRPLSLDEVNIIVNMEDATNAGCQNIKEFEKQYLGTNITADIYKVLGPLVRISESKVYLVHISLKEFLCTSICQLDDRGLSNRFHVDLWDAHLYLASACTAYLMLDDFATDLFATHRSSPRDRSLDSQSESEAREEQEPWEETMFIFGNLLQESDEIDADTYFTLASKFQLFEYSALHWARHFALGQDAATEETRVRVLHLSNRKSQHRFQNWFKFYSIKSGLPLPSSLDFEPLTVGGFFDHFTLLDGLLTPSGTSYSGNVVDALYWASRNGHSKSVARLLKTEVEPDSKTVDSQSALGISAELGYSDVVKALIADARVDVNFKGQKEKTPLSMAAGNGHVEVVSLFLRHELVEADAKASNGMTPLIWAIRGRQARVTRLLANDPRVNTNNVDCHGRTPFSWAAEDGDENIIAILLPIPGIDVDRADHDGHTPVHFAARFGHTGVLKQLKRANKLDISHSHKDKTRRNAFGWAAWGGHNAIIQLLFKYGLPGVDEEDEFKWTPLFWALEASNCTTIETLLATGKVNVNHKDHSGRTALFWTAGYGKEDMVKVLLAAEGIDAQATNDEGHTPLQWARKLDKQVTAALLENFFQRKVKSSQ